MSDLKQLRYGYGLKQVERSCSVAKRKESAAEHSWSCLILADYFLTKIKLDRLKVYEMLIYHDLVEIETGDVDILNVEKRYSKKEQELKAIKVVEKKVPPLLSLKIKKLFLEFEEQKTKEAKFSKAIDALDAEIHELDYKKDWQGWTEAFLRKSKEHLFADFPELRKMFEETTKYARENGFFEK